MISIEKYRPDDFAVLASMIGRLQEYERHLMPDLKPPNVVVDAYVKDLVETADADRGAILIARDDFHAIGCVAGHFREDDDPCLAEDARIYAHVSDLYVDDSWRMRGVGRLLLTAIEEQMKLRGGTSIRTAVRVLNTAALRCFAGFGCRQMKVVLSKQI